MHVLYCQVQDDSRCDMSVMVRECDGFLPTDDEQRRLEEIDKQLHVLLPTDRCRLTDSVTPTSDTPAGQVSLCCHWSVRQPPVR